MEFGDDNDTTAKNTKAIALGTPESQNPWPHLNDYFLFKSREEDKLAFNCKLCDPKTVLVKAHITSLNNLKQHMRRTHPEVSLKFQHKIKLARWKRRKRAENDSVMKISKKSSSSRQQESGYEDEFAMNATAYMSYDADYEENEVTIKDELAPNFASDNEDQALLELSLKAEQTNGDDSYLHNQEPYEFFQTNSTTEQQLQRICETQSRAMEMLAKAAQTQAEAAKINARAMQQLAAGVKCIGEAAAAQTEIMAEQMRVMQTIADALLIMKPGFL